MFREPCRILENKKIAPGHFILRLASARIASAARPGAFVQVLCSNASDPLLPRPFSFLTAGKNDFSVLYQVVGKGTTILSQLKKGEALWVVGPLGNGFGMPAIHDPRSTIHESARSFVLIGGGVGIPPLYHLAQELIQKKKIKPKDIHVFLGARNRSLLLCETDFKKLGVLLSVATDDGSKGKKGFVTDLLKDFLRSSTHDPRSTTLYTCGPTPMLKAVSAIAVGSGVPCEVSVEVPMACGFGACLGCAIKVRSQKTEGRNQMAEHRFAVACCEGPVFKAEDILWD